MPNHATAGPDRLTVLTSVSGKRCSKRWFRNPDGTVGVETYGFETNWLAQGHDVSTFTRLATLLTELSQTSSQLVIRGALKDDTALMPDDGWVRRIHGFAAPFRDEPRRWVALDIDGLRIPNDYPTPNQTDKVAWVIAQLPAEWHGVSVVYQWTSSQGMTGDAQRMQLRLWYLLDAPVSDMAWRGYWRTRAERLALDVSLFRATQPHYINSPEFTGLPDPVVRRIGAIPGALGDVVPISAIMSDADRMRAPAGGVACEALPFGLANRHQIETTLERINAQVTNGARHMHMLGAACELFSIGCPYEVAVPTLEALLTRQGRDPAECEIRAAWDHASRRQMAGNLRGAQPADVTFGEEPVQPTAEEAQDNLRAASTIASQEVHEWSKNDYLNALRYLQLQHPDNTFLRTAQTDFEWRKGRWVPLESDEVLQDRISRLSAREARVCSATARSVRSLVSQERLTAPCWISTRDNAARWVSFTNGALNVERWAQDPTDRTAFRQHSPDLFTHVQCPYAWSPRAEAPAFDGFLDSVFPHDDQAKREFLKMLGYLMTPDNSHQKLFILGGVPGSGKSTANNLIRQLVGPESCCAPTMQSLGGRFHRSLLGKSVALVAEANRGGETNSVAAEAVDIIKRITGGDEVEIDRKHKDEVTVRLPLRFVFACNRLPQFIDPSGAMKRRVQLFWFRHSHVGREDINLAQRLEAELPGIAVRALTGLRWLLEDGKFREVQSSSEVMRNYERQMAPVLAFLDDCAHLEPAASTPRADVYSAYRVWCSNTGRMAMGADRFVAELTEVDGSLTETRTTLRQGGRRQVIHGLRLRAEVSQAAVADWSA